MTIRSARRSQNFLAPELVLTTRPVLRVVFDYEPDDTDPFECLPFAVAGPEPQETGDGDAVCGRFEIGLSDDATLLQADFVPPYAGGSVDLQDTREVFSIPVCAELAGLIGIGPLADVCAIRLNAQVTASLSAPDGAGGPYQGPEGSPIRLQAAGAGPGGSLGECEPTGVRFDWTFDDGTTATGAVVDETFADDRPSPHQATLQATDGAATRAASRSPSPWPTWRPQRGSPRPRDGRSSSSGRWSRSRPAPPTPAPSTSSPSPGTSGTVGHGR